MAVNNTILRTDAATLIPEEQSKQIIQGIVEDSAVLKLESYDRKNGTELLGTLHAYLSCHKNLSEAAAFLYVHRNTLTKRLERINDLIHVDLDDAETVFHLMFSYRLIEYYGATVLRNSYENWMERAPTLRHP